jgi:preprotein translocase subunit SecF
VTGVINFLGVRRICITISLILIVAGLASMTVISGLNFGIDFRGGVHIVAKFTEPVTTADVISVLQTAGVPNLKAVAAPENEILIDSVAEEAGIGQKIAQTLRAKYPVLDVSITEVGANVGRDLRRIGIIATALSLGLMLLYISFRFQWRYAVGAVVALAHDVLITLGAFSVLQLEINLPTLAAFLTVVGYSVNDTIVIFDRIRENQRLMRGMRLDDLMNTSITQTLSRTLLTSLATLFVVVVIFLESGPGELRTFSLALIFGIIVGTYSSIYIASPLVLLLQPKASLAD